jgi:hypothetical protein
METCTASSLFRSSRRARSRSVADIALESPGKPRQELQ